MVRDVVEVRGAAVARAGHFEIPKRDLALGGQPGADLHHGRRTERIEEELLRAVPDHLHGFAGDLGQARRVHRLRRRRLASETRPRRA